MNREAINTMRDHIFYQDAEGGIIPVLVAQPYFDDLEFFYDTLVVHSIDYFVWDFENAPPILRALSQNGGDEDWVVVSLDGDWQPWVERMDTGAEPDHYMCEIYPDLHLHILIVSHA